MVITDSNRVDFNLQVNALFKDVNNWLKNNLLNLNFTKTHYLEFRPSKHHLPNLQIRHNHKYISNVTQTKFLGLMLDDTLMWNHHTDLLIKKNDFNKLCPETGKTHIAFRNTKSNLFCSCTFHYKLRCDLLGQLTKCHQCVQVTKENNQNYY